MKKTMVWLLGLAMDVVDGSLFGQHAQTIHHLTRTMPAGPHAKRRRLLTVHHVVAQGFTRLDQAAGNRWHFAREAGGGGVDDHLHV